MLRLFWRHIFIRKNLCGVYNYVRIIELRIWCCVYKIKWQNKKKEKKKRIYYTKISTDFRIFVFVDYIHQFHQQNHDITIQICLHSESVNKQH